MQAIYDVLGELRIPFVKHEHPAVFTVEEASQLAGGFGAAETKNLFLRNAKGNVHYLVVAESSKRVDLKQLTAVLGETKLSFASPERLMTHLRLTPGSVSPFGLINNTDKSVRVIVDSGLLSHERVGFHPNINTATLVITAQDFRKFLAWIGNEIRFIEL